MVLKKNCQALSCSISACHAMQAQKLKKPATNPLPSYLSTGAKTLVSRCQWQELQRANEDRSELNSHLCQTFLADSEILCRFATGFH